MDCPDAQREPIETYCKAPGCNRVVGYGYCLKCQQGRDEAAEMERDDRAIERKLYED